MDNIIVCDIAVVQLIFRWLQQLLLRW